MRNGWNYVRVKHNKGSVTTTTNYVEWVCDKDASSLTTSSNSLTFTGSGTRTISGVTYNTGGNCVYAVTVDNAYKYVYDDVATTFTTSVAAGSSSGAAVTNASYSIDAIS